MCGGRGELDLSEAGRWGGVELGKLDQLESSSLPSFLRCSGVMGHTQHAYDRPWIEIDKHVTPTLARIVGASCALSLLS